MLEQRDSAPDRRGFLGAGLAGAAGLAAVGAFGGAASAQQGGDNVPNLYPNWNARQFRALRAHENQHVAFIVGLLGANARPKPNFRNLNPTSLRQFVTISRTLSTTGVGAYIATGPIIFNKQRQTEATSILGIEAQHAGYLNTAVNLVETANAFGQEQTFGTPLTAEQVLSLAGPFIQDLNGGPPAAFSLTPSAENDIAILNFALILEYLEQEFYNINVPRFFPGA